MLEISNATKYYRIKHGRSRRIILKGINFKINKGEKWGIMGRNGAGKSTLIRIISGSELPNSGTIKRNMSISWPLAFGDAFIGRLTGKDNTRLIARVYGVHYEQMLSYVEEFAELGEYLSEPVVNYSSGMAARLAFAISMAIEFDCYLIDEVLSVGDHRFTEKCKADLFEKRANRSMIFVSHHTDLIKAYCDHAAILNEGCLQTYESVDKAIEAYYAL